MRPKWRKKSGRSLEIERPIEFTFGRAMPPSRANTATNLRLTPEAFEIHQKISRRLSETFDAGPRRRRKCAGRAAEPTAAKRFWIACSVTPGEWWIGHHRVGSIASSWPGGMLNLELPPDAVSRAWLKMEEALRWSRLPIPRDARVAEIGSAPGGASQALLARGCYVTGIDPAEMDPAVLEHPHFTHLRRRSTQVRRREFRKIRWLAVDMNVAPSYTLDAVEEIVTHPEINIRGMILTLKFPDWSLAAEVPEYLARIKSWGYNLIRARQLQHNRREICVAALQKPFRRKTSHD